MIIWLASYPKSGNTLLRSILSSYFYSNDGIFTFENLEKISQFPQTSHLMSLVLMLIMKKKYLKIILMPKILLIKKKKK